MTFDTFLSEPSSGLRGDAEQGLVTMDEAHYWLPEFTFQSLIRCADGQPLRAHEQRLIDAIERSKVSAILLGNRLRERLSHDREEAMQADQAAWPGGRKAASPLPPDLPLFAARWVEPSCTLTLDADTHHYGNRALAQPTAPTLSWFLRSKQRLILTFNVQGERPNPPPGAIRTIRFTCETERVLNWREGEVADQVFFCT